MILDIPRVAIYTEVKMHIIKENQVDNFFNNTTVYYIDTTRTPLTSSTIKDCAVFCSDIVDDYYIGTLDYLAIYSFSPIYILTKTSTLKVRMYIDNNCYRIPNDTQNLNYKDYLMYTNVGQNIALHSGLANKYPSAEQLLKLRIGSRLQL